MRDVLEFWIQLHSHPEIEISFKFIPKILMSKECIHFFGPICIILSSAPVCSTYSLHFSLIQRYYRYRFFRLIFICYYRSYECTVKSVQMVYSDIWRCKLLSGSVDL